MEFIENLSGAIRVGTTLIFSPLLRSRYNRWGTSPEEAGCPLPGDELVPDPQMGYTRAITIQAPPAQIWPWLVQIGQGRGGLYSYDGLENLAGCNIHTADRILPEYQNLRVGEVIRMGPKGYPCFGVASFEPERSLVLISLDIKTEQVVPYVAQPGKGYSIATWQFALEPRDDNTSRLLVRQRLAFSPDMARIWRLTEPVAFVMERKMLLNIRQRAENNG